MPQQGQKSLPQVVSELWDLLKSYAKQETVEPFKGLGRFLMYGLPAALIGGIGFVLLMLAGLRALQTETGSTFTGNWSWAPYVITLVGGVIALAYAVSRISKSQKRETAQ